MLSFLSFLFLSAIDACARDAHVYSNYDDFDDESGEFFSNEIEDDFDYDFE